MLLTVNESLAPELRIAHRIVETVVLRSKAGAVFTVEIGESISPVEGPTFGGKVTRLGETPMHLGICEGQSVAYVFDAAQQLVMRAIAGSTEPAIPKPHVKIEDRVSA